MTSQRVWDLRVVAMVTGAARAARQKQEIADPRQQSDSSVRSLSPPTVQYPGGGGGERRGRNADAGHATDCAARGYKSIFTDYQTHNTPQYKSILSGIPPNHDSCALFSHVTMSPVGGASHEPPLLLPLV